MPCAGFLNLLEIATVYYSFTIPSYRVSKWCKKITYKRPSREVTLIEFPVVFAIVIVAIKITKSRNGKFTMLLQKKKITPCWGYKYFWSWTPLDFKLNLLLNGSLEFSTAFALTAWKSKSSLKLWHTPWNSSYSFLNPTGIFHWYSQHGGYNYFLERLSGVAVGKKVI